ncbi:MAG: T9SS type A sorting domain-containing protein [Chitinophagales bacterium]|nr:T9SS type A sorting domain-containing protein [Chitinophagales bacterium]
MTKTVLTGLFIMLIVYCNAQWSGVNSNTSYDLGNMQMISASKGFLAGQENLFTTNDGGVNWSAVYYNQPDSALYKSLNYNSLKFINANIGVAVAYSFFSNAGVITRTGNGGTVWATQYTAPTATRLNDITFCDSTTGIAVGNSGLIVRTTDGGLNWAAVSSPVNAPLYAVAFDPSNPAVGLIASQSGILRTTDSGASWYVVPSTAAWIKSVNFAAPGIAYGISYLQQLYKSTDGGATWQLPATTLTGVNDIFFVSADTGYACGDKVYKTTNGGVAWQYQNTAEGNFVYFYSADLGFCGSTDGFLYRTTNGGANQWKPMAAITLGGQYRCTDSLYTYSTFYDPSYSYQWQFNHQTISTNVADSSIMQGTYSGDTLSLIVSNGILSDTANKLFNTDGDLRFTMQPLRVGTDSLCRGQSTIIYIDSSVTNATYRLSANGLNIGNFLNGNGQTISFTLPSVNSTTTYVVTATRSSTICGSFQAVKSQLIEVVTPDTPTISTGPNALCWHDTAAIIIQQSVPGTNYFLMNGFSQLSYTAVGNGSTISVTAPNMTNDITFGLRMVNYLGCTTTVANVATFNVKKLNVEFGRVEDVFVGQNINLVNYSNGDNYTWQFDSTCNVLSDTTTRPAPVFYTTTGEKVVYLKATTTEGCEDSIAHRVRVVIQADTITPSQVCLFDTIQLKGPVATVLAHHVDRFGNQYVGGFNTWQYYGSNYNGSYHYFLQKFDNNGQLVWEKSTTPFSYSNFWRNDFYASHVTGITTDPAGNLYVCGSFGGEQIIFDTISIYQADHYNNYYIAKFDSSGTFKWMTRSGNTGLGQIFGASDLLYIDSNHLMVMVSGTYSSYGLILPNDSLALTNTFTSSTMALQLNSDGWYQGSYPVTKGTGTDNLILGPYCPNSDMIITAWMACVDPKMHLRNDGKIIVTGNFSDSIKFGQQPTLIPLTEKVGGFAATLNPYTGWEKSFLTYSSDKSPSSSDFKDKASISAIDRDGNLYITRRILYEMFKASTIQLERSITFTDTTGGCVLMRYDTSGHLSFAVKVNTAFINALAVSNDGTNVFLAGDYFKMAGFNSVSGPIKGNMSIRLQDSYIAAYDSAGDFKWIETIGSTGTESIQYMAKNCESTLYCLGSSTGNCKIKNTPLNSQSYRNWFLKYDPESRNCQQQICPVITPVVTTAVSYLPLGRVMAYPNPATSELNISIGDQTIQEAAIYTPQGQLVQTIVLPPNNKLLINNLTAGIYIAKLKVNRNTLCVRFIKMD